MVIVILFNIEFGMLLVWVWCVCLIDDVLVGVYDVYLVLLCGLCLICSQIECSGLFYKLLMVQYGFDLVEVVENLCVGVVDVDDV